MSRLEETKLEEGQERVRLVVTLSGVQKATHTIWKMPEHNEAHCMGTLLFLELLKMAEGK